MIWLCSMYAKTKKASRKNQKILTNQRKGRKAKPPKERGKKKNLTKQTNKHTWDIISAVRDSGIQAPLWDPGI